MELIVKQVPQKDAGRGLVFIDRGDFSELGVQEGDYVSIKGTESPKNSVVGKVFPGYASDSEQKIVRMDGGLRHAANVGIDEKVNIEKIEVKDAESVSTTIPKHVKIIGGDHRGIAQMVGARLKGRAVSVGQTIPINFSIFYTGVRVPVIIAATKPKGPVQVTDETVIKFSIDRELGDTKRETVEPLSDITYEDIGGLSDQLGQIREMIELPMRHPELWEQLGIEPPKGVLLHGPPGTGKTLIAQAVANEIDAHFISISGPEIMSKYYGESEGQLREVFEEAEKNSPAIVFLDEIDSIAPRREEASGDVERRVVAQLLTLMDGLKERGQVVVIAATNRVNAIDPALRRGGRFDREIEIGVPSKEGRLEILQVHTRGMPLEEGIDLEQYADKTHGFVGSDLESLARESAMNALRRVMPDLDLEIEEIPEKVLEKLEIKNEDLKNALRWIEPSALREVFVEVPDTSWEDIGGLETTKQRLREAIQWPLKYPEVFEALGLDSAAGILLYGPPGTGKTLLAKAVASESEANFISLKGPELLNKYVGESEKGVREIFAKARQNAPVVVFFDEIDSIAAQRGKNASDSGVSERVVSQLLTEMNGLEELENVVVIATTNRPDLIDPALLRPGRFDFQVHIPMPDESARRSIFEIHTKEKPVSEDIDLDQLASRTEGYNGADIAAVCREAAAEAGREYINSVKIEDIPESVGNIRITQEYFDMALEKISPSVDERVIEFYEDMKTRLGKRLDVVNEEDNELSMAFQ
jgi:transitional endoplasmic reticulum ATPase